jgi:DNA-binding XRE family transcriptional regulator
VQSKILNNPKIPTGVELTRTVPRCPTQTFADRLRAYRRERGWRQVDLADALGVHKDTVRNWEAGRVEPRLEILRVEGAGIIRGLCESRVGAARDSGNDALG